MKSFPDRSCPTLIAVFLFHRGDRVGSVYSQGTDLPLPKERDSQGTGLPVPKEGKRKLSFRMALAMRNLLLLFEMFCVASFAQTTPERGIMVREAQLYLSPDTGSQRLSKVGRGHEVAVIERSHEFIKVLANVRESKAVGIVDEDQSLSITGWIIDKGVIRASTPNGDKILFGEGSDSEAEASKAHGRRGAAEDAMRLYAETAEYFPNSPLAGEALWRSADIRWQLERADASTRKGSRSRDPELRPHLEDRYLREVQKKFPNTKWADMAAYDRLDQKLCGEWEGLPKCPEDESGMYEKYVKEHPQSPKDAEALYEAAWRQAALIDIYKTRNDAGKAGAAKSHSLGLCQQIESQYAQATGDWAQRAARLRYLVEQDIPTYGNAID